MFKQSIQKLLSGAVICETAHEAEYHYLKAESGQSKVDDFLANLDRQLTYLSSADAFYCTFSQVDDSNHHELSILFLEMRSTFRPLVEFLELLLTATHADLPIRAKSSININELFDPFEHDQTLSANLSRLTSIKPFKTNKTETREQLVMIFQKLEEMQYLVRKNTGSSRYYATARFDLIYLLIEFLNDSEQITLPQEESSPQDELLF
ncbi:MAG: hypothetical protein JKX76_09385 [Colwellia sp.]|nr:hypothetical protein [Colwellia sp.]